MHIDTLSITGKIPANQTDKFISAPDDWAWTRALRLLPCLRALNVEIGPSRGRVNGYTHAWSLIWDGEAVGHVAAGGNTGGPSAELRARERNVERLQGWQVYLNGTGCALVDTVRGAWERLAQTVHQQRYRVTRLDLAHDDLAGERDVQYAVRAYQDGRFKQARGGRMPTVSQAGNWLTEDGRGRTLYVGSRAGAQMCRIYEKGKQLGDAGSRWVRWEVEFKHDDDYPVPAYALVRRDAFFCGAYPVLREFGRGAERRESVRVALQTSYDVLVRHARIAYGRLVHAMAAVGDDPAQALTDGVPLEVPRRLRAWAGLAGLYLPPGSNTGGNLSTECGA